MNNYTLLCLTLLFCVMPLSAGTLYVDIDNTHGPWNGSLEFPYRNIQQAINAAAYGTDILVASGTYYENLVINNKDLTLSAMPRAAVVINGRQLGSVVTIYESDVQLARLTVTNGLANWGGGINIHFGFVNLYQITVTANSTRDGQDSAGPGGAGANAGGGGGIFASTSSLGISHCTISSNSTGKGGNANVTSDADGGDGGSGGGLWVWYGFVCLTDCTITGNTTGAGGDGGLPEYAENRGGSSGSGAGVYIVDNDDIWLENCDITDNVIGSGGDAKLQGGNTGDGGGAYILGYGPTSIYSCRFLRNTAGMGGYAEWGGESGHGGGAYIAAAWLAEISSCEFADNVGGFGGDGWDHGGDGGHGGGVFIGGRAAIMTDCIITGNSSGQGQGKGKGGSGGGLYVFADVTLTNCLIAQNAASGGPYVDYDGNGGGICVGDSSLSVTVTNCTIADNMAEHNGYVLGRGGGLFSLSPSVTVNSSILWNNFAYNVTTEAAQIDGVAPAVNYTCIEGWTGGFGGFGNMGYNPQFADPVNHDYHVRSTYGRWDPAAQSWILDIIHSPCIDGGDPSDMNWINELWPHGKRINMGVYGGTSQAGKSDNVLTGNVADINRDNAVDMTDLVLLAGKWLQTVILCPEDMNFDGKINLEDFAILGENWVILIY
jgi:hypothetical protein